MLSPYPQVLLSWSGGPSSSSMVWQVLEVHLHHLVGVGFWIELAGASFLSLYDKATG